MVWQYEKGNIVYSKAASLNGDGKLIGSIMDLDTTKQTFFGSKPSYYFVWSEDKTKLLLYKIQTRNNEYTQVTKVYDKNFQLLDSSKRILAYNDNREEFGNLQIDNNGTIVFEKVKEVTPLHSCYISTKGQKAENWSEHTFHLPSDKNKEVVLSILIFHLPDK